jgi:type III secretion system FlhB-like substrate exporter
MVNLHKLNFPEYMPHFVSGSIGGVAAVVIAQAPGSMVAGMLAASLIYYGPGHVAAFIMEEAKQVGLPFLTGLSAMSLVVALSGMRLDTMVDLLTRSPLQGVALGAVNYAVGVTLLRYGSGHVAAANLNLVKNTLSPILVNLKSLGGITVERMLGWAHSLSPQSLIGNGVHYAAVGATFIHHGSGRVGASIVTWAKKVAVPVLIASSIFLTGALSIITVGMMLEFAYHHPLQTLVLCGAGWGVGSRVIHYGPGRVTASIVALAKNTLVAFFIGLNVTFLLAVFMGAPLAKIDIFITLSLPVYPAAFALLCYAHCGSGRIAVAIKGMVKPVIMGLVGCNIGGIGGLVGTVYIGAPVGALIYERYPILSTFFPSREQGAQAFAIISMSYFIGTCLMKYGSGRVAALTSFIKSSYSLGVTGFMAGGIGGIALGAIELIQVCKNRADPEG